MQSPPLPKEVMELFQHLMVYAQRGDLGVVSTLDKETTEPRWTLIGRHLNPDGTVKYVPLGFIATDAGEKVYAPDEEPTIYELTPAETHEQFMARAAQDAADDYIGRWADDGGAG